MVVEEQAHELIARWIEPHPWKGGAAEARLTEGKVSVWAIIGQLGGDTDDPAAIAVVAGDYDVPPEAVAAALAYYREHRAAIDDRLAANQPPANRGRLSA